MKDIILAVTLVAGCGSAAAPQATGVQVSFVQPRPLGNCDVDYQFLSRGSPPPFNGDGVQLGFCSEPSGEAGDIALAVFDLPPGEWTMHVSVDMPPEHYCSGRSDFVIEEGQTTEVELTLVCV